MNKGSLTQKGSLMQEGSLMRKGSLRSSHKMCNLPALHKAIWLPC